MKFRLTQFLATLICCSFLAACSGGSGPDNAVQTDKGVVIGKTIGNVNYYLGIPYAAAPVGNLRWQAPQAAIAWNQPRLSTTFGPACPQLASPFGTASNSEDCLRLNVFAPVARGSYPVMVWIHGGGLTSGESSDYDPSALVNSGVIVVTLNYRLGALGFLTHPALAGAGNYGLMDQQAALKWVQTNIASFGGNPGNVTLFGQSAGGMSTLAQISSPLSAGLFHKAIVQSGAYNLQPLTISTAQALGQTFASATGCASQTAACLQALPVSTILANANLITAAGSQLPTVDLNVLPTTIAQSLSSGHFNKVPMIEGTTEHEYSILSVVAIDSVQGHQLTASEYPTYLSGIFGASNATLLQLVYPLTPAHTPAWTLDNILTDYGFACNGRSVARVISTAGVPVYTYEFADANAPMFFNVPLRTDGYGAFHASELAYLFPGSSGKVYYGSPLTAAQTALSTQMVSFWSQFAKTGNPNASGSSLWPAYTSSNDTDLSMVPGAVTGDTTFASAHNCAIWLPADVGL